MTYDDQKAFDKANPEIAAQLRHEATPINTQQREEQEQEQQAREEEREENFLSALERFARSWREKGVYITFDKKLDKRIFILGGEKLTEKMVQDIFAKQFCRHTHNGGLPKGWRSVVVDRLSKELILVSGEKFLPNGPEFIRLTDGVHFVNVWKPFVVVSTVLEDGSAPNLDLFFELVERIIPDKEQREYFYDWLADLVQHPENRKPVGLYFVSDEGTGKGRLLEWIIKRLVVYQCIETTTLPASNRFGLTGYDRILLAVFDDFGRVPVTTTRKMKDSISENSIPIEEKGKDPRQAPAFFRVIVFTNEIGAYPLSAGDRRWTVFSYVEHRISKDETLAFMTRFRKELERCGEKPMVHGAPGAAYVSAVYQWLMAREYNEDRLYLPLETELGNQIKGVKEEDEQNLLDLVAPYDALTVEWIKYTFSIPLSDNAIADALQANGWRKQDNGVDHNGNRRRTWFRPEAFPDGYSAKYLRGRVNIERKEESEKMVVDDPATLAQETEEKVNTPSISEVPAAPAAPEAPESTVGQPETNSTTCQPEEDAMFYPDIDAEDERKPEPAQPATNDGAGFWMYVNGVKTWYELPVGSGEKPVKILSDDDLPEWAKAPCPELDNLPEAQASTADNVTDNVWHVWDAANDCWVERKPIALN